MVLNTDSRAAEITAINPKNFSDFFPKVYSKLSLPATSLIFTGKQDEIYQQVSKLESLRAKCEEVQIRALLDIRKEDVDTKSKYGLNIESLKKTLEENQIIREKYLIDLIRAKGYDVTYDTDTRLVTIDYGSGEKLYGTAYSIIDAHPDLLELHDISKTFESKSNKNIEHILSIKSKEGSAFKSSIALAGSFAQKEINPNPADFDFNEYIDIKSQNLNEGVQIFKNAILQNFEMFENHPNIHIVEFKFGRVVLTNKEGEKVRVFLQWTKEEIERGYKELEFEGRIIPIDFQKHLLGLGRKDMIKFDLLTNISGTFKECSKIINLRIKDSENQNLFSHKISYAPLQEVFYEDPTVFEVVNSTSNLDVFGNYYGDIFNDALKYSQCNPEDISNSPNCNPLKSAKRIYTFLKTQGRIQEARQISEILDSEYSKLYQIYDSLGITIRVLDIFKTSPSKIINIPNIISSLENNILEINNDKRLSNYELASFFKKIQELLQAEDVDFESIKSSILEIKSKLSSKINTEVYKFLLAQNSYTNILENTKYYLGK